MSNPLLHEAAADYREELVPGYETDPSAVGTNRVVDPAAVDNRDWSEIHGLSTDEVAELAP